MASTKVLIIDDEQDVIDLLSFHLRKAGYVLSTATDGATGLRLSREELPALIILDLMLPKMPGLEICKVLKTDAATRHIPVLMLTAKADDEKKLSIGPITLDPARHHVEVAGKPLRLTSVEFKLLNMLMRRQGRVQERDRLLNEVWGYESVIDTRTVDTHVRRLRKKLGKAANAIETVRGFGYRIRER